jgi:TrmH family RNA methyltransferase
VRAELTSTRNPRVKQLVALRRRRTRDELGVTLIDGYDELVLALDAGVRPETVYYCPALLAPVARDLDARLTELAAEQVPVSREVFAKVSYRENPDGWLAVVPSPAVALASLALPARPLLLVCEAVEKPGNLGAMLRTADAAGVAAVIAAGPVTDWGNPNLVRASKGTVFAVPVAAAEPAEVLDWLAAHDVALVATSPDADATLDQIDLTGPVAIAVGAEHAGLSPALLAAATHIVRIPMFGRVNSLNVSASAAIALYEAVRQRASGSGDDRT